MEVESCDDTTPVAATLSQTPVTTISEIVSDNATTTSPADDSATKSPVKYDIATTTSSSLATLLDTVPDPSPKSISEAEMKVLQVTIVVPTYIKV